MTNATDTYLLCGNCAFGRGGCETLELFNGGSCCDACTHPVEQTGDHW